MSGAWRTLRIGLPSTSLHAYAGDTQLYLHFRHDEMTLSADQLERCVLDIGQWMSANRLKLNADTTELLFASSGHCCAALTGSYPVLKLGGDAAVASSHVRLLGVDIYLDLSVDRHITTTSTPVYPAVAGL